MAAAWSGRPMAPPAAMKSRLFISAIRHSFKDQITVESIAPLGSRREWETALRGPAGSLNVDAAREFLEQIVAVPGGLEVEGLANGHETIDAAPAKPASEAG